MSIFKRNQKPGFTAAAPTNSRIVQDTVRTSSEPPNPFYQRLQNQASTRRLSPKPRSAKATPSPKPRAQQQRKRPTPTSQRLEFDDDDNDVSEEDLDTSARKRARRISFEPDVDRKIRSRKAFSDENGGQFSMVHAAGIASLSQPAKYRPAFPDYTDKVEIQLQYPSASQKEKYVIKDSFDS